MNSKRNIDDILFDRLVDNELSLTERRTLLQVLDTHPNGWRRCALAFLEAQSWRESSHAIVGKPTTTAPAAHFDTGDKKSLAPTSDAPRISKKSVAQWLAIAAALLVAFRVGSLERESLKQIASSPAPTENQLASTPQSANVAAPSAPGASQAAPKVAKPGDALNLWVRDDAGQMRRVRVPLVDASTLDPELGLQFQTGVPDDVRDRLRNQGYTVQSKRQFAPMWLDNGRPMIVPVEDTKIVPVSNKVY